MSNPNTVGPRPHYLLPDWKLEVTSSGKSAHLEGRVLFSTSDSSVGDRVDHVNAMTHGFAVWNAAHLMCMETGLINPRSVETTVWSHKVTPPDVEVDMVVDSVIVSENDGRVRGRTNAVFSRDGVVLCEVLARFVASRA